MLLISILLGILIAHGIWVEVKLEFMEKDMKRLRFMKGQQVARQEFDGLKNIVNRLRRNTRNV